MATRIYLVSETGEEETEGTSSWLVEASSPAQAIRHKAKRFYTAEPATALEVARMMLNGHKVETA